MDSTVNRFAELAGIDVGKHIERKQNMAYLSWAWAVDQLLRRDPTASWSYGEPQKWGDTVMVFCTVTAFGQPRTMQLPVMDHKNKAIANPDAFAVNTAMQRCLVKAIALHGLGLYIYAGEDVPQVEESQPELDNAIVAKFEAAASIADVGATWNAIPKDERAGYRTVKDRAMERIGGAQHAA